MGQISESQVITGKEEGVKAAPKFIVSVGPQVGTSLSTEKMMTGVLLALLPAVAFSVYLFGRHALYLYLTCGFSAVMAELVSQKVRRIKVTINDKSALLTGILLAACLPPSFPLWMGGLGAVFGIVVGKVFFGGLGFNIFNPALLGRAFLSATFPNQMTTWSAPALDAITTATPLGAAKFSHIFASYRSLFFGTTAGSLGETSALLLILGGIYIIVRSYADWRIPVGYILTVFLFSNIFHLVNPARFATPLFHLLAGGLMLGALFMATDPVTTPLSKKGRWIFGIGCGILTMVVRLFGGMPEGVAYSILFMNALTPLINRGTKPRRFGT
ncbi:MAG: RnfABCDGE type electron transport complex subunit D [Candidatus Omnitrophota bacterium]